MIKAFCKRPASIVLGRGRLREPILVSDQLQLRPLFGIPEVFAASNAQGIFLTEKCKPREQMFSYFTYFASIDLN